MYKCRKLRRMGIFSQAERMWYSGYTQPNAPEPVSTQCPRGKNYLCIRNSVLGQRKRQTHYFKPFITCINISAEINKGWQACLEDSCSLLRLASLERAGAPGMPSIPAPSKTPPSLFNHPLRTGWQEALSRWAPPMAEDGYIVKTEVRGAGGGSVCSGDKQKTPHKRIQGKLWGKCRSHVSPRSLQQEKRLLEAEGVSDKCDCNWLSVVGEES